MLDAYIADIQRWLMLHRFSPGAMLLYIAVAVAVGVVLMKFFRPPRV